MAYESIETLDKVLSDLKDKKDNELELSDEDKKSYWELVNKFSSSVKEKLKDFKDWDITEEVRLKVEDQLWELDKGLDNLTVDNTISKIEEIKEILNMDIEMTSTKSSKKIEELISGSEFDSELTELSANIKETESGANPAELEKTVKEEIEELAKLEDDEEIKNKPKQKTDVTGLYEKPEKKVERGGKTVLDKIWDKINDNDILNVEVWSKTKNFFGKAREFMKKWWAEAKKIILSPIWIAAWLWVWIMSIFSKKFRRTTGNVIWAPFSAIGGWVQRVTHFVWDAITYPFRLIWWLFRRKKVAFNRVGAEDKVDDVIETSKTEVAKTETTTTEEKPA